MYELGWMLFGAIALYTLWCLLHLVTDGDWRRPTTWVVHYTSAGFCEWRNGTVVNEIRVGGATPGELLDQCIPARARLAFVERQLCQQTLAEPGSALSDAIRKAVYEGRGVFTCIQTIENRRSSMRESQDAAC